VVRPTSVEMSRNRIFDRGETGKVEAVLCGLAPAATSGAGGGIA
jgi:hypothetical protein